jgi:hypothetical protein
MSQTIFSWRFECKDRNEAETIALSLKNMVENLKMRIAVVGNFIVIVKKIIKGIEPAISTQELRTINKALREFIPE